MDCRVQVRGAAAKYAALCAKRKRPFVIGKYTCRFIEEVGTHVVLRTSWDSSTCPKQRFPAIHSAGVIIQVTDIPRDMDAGGKLEDHLGSKHWPKVCAYCGMPVPANAQRRLVRVPKYNTQNGYPSVGDMFYKDMHDKGVCPDWGDDCTDEHLICVLPDRQEWDMDARADNCTMKYDNQHRCWIRHGVPPLITVDKRGLSCHAGGGSILGRGYHGFLVGGELTDG